jgi:proline iminopeptidase
MQSGPSHYDDTGRDKTQEAGVRLIPISTPKGEFRVWTKRVGDNPDVRLLLLHGGPAATHEYFESFNGYLPGAGIEYYFYDQLGSFFSDQPDDHDLWEVDRFVDEVEQVRVALDLGPENFFLLGHSWGGILAIEYALRYQQHLRGLIISNMMSSIPAYNEYAETILMPKMDQDALAEIKQLEARGEIEDPRYMELLMEHHYVRHVLRLPADEWPEPVNNAFAHTNQKIYVSMQGPSELGASGKLASWDRSADLYDIQVPTLVISGNHDTMDPGHLQAMTVKLPKGHYLSCPHGSHMSMWDDQDTYFAGLIDFLRTASA